MDNISVQIQPTPTIQLKIGSEVIYQKLAGKYFEVANETERLALPTAQEGDFCRQLDTAEIFYLKSGGTASDPTSWFPFSQIFQFGQIAGTVCEGNDPRLSNARQPLTHDQNASTILDDSDFQKANVRDLLNALYSALDLRGFGIAPSHAHVNAGETIVVDRIDLSVTRVGKWLVNIVDQTIGSMQTTEVIAHFDGLSPMFTEYGSIGSSSVTFSVDTLDGYLRLLCTALADNQTITAVRANIKIV